MSGRQRGLELVVAAVGRDDAAEQPAEHCRRRRRGEEEEGFYLPRKRASSLSDSATKFVIQLRFFCCCHLSINFKRV